MAAGRPDASDWNRIAAPTRALQGTARGGLFIGPDSTIYCIAIKGLFGRQAGCPLETKTERLT